MFLRQYPDIKVNYSTVLDPELNAAIGKGSEMEVSANLKPVLAKLASKARTIVKEKTLKRCAPKSRRKSKYIYTKFYEKKSSFVKIGMHEASRLLYRCLIYQCLQWIVKRIVKISDESFDGAQILRRCPQMMCLIV